MKNAMEKGIKLGKNFGAAIILLGMAGSVFAAGAYNLTCPSAQEVLTANNKPFTDSQGTQWTSPGSSNNPGPGINFYMAEAFEGVGNEASYQMVCFYGANGYSASVQSVAHNFLPDSTDGKFEKPLPGINIQLNCGYPATPAGIADCSFKQGS